MANVQHDCHEHKCPVKLSGVVYQEREESTERRLEVNHINPNSRVLNTAQMRSAAYLAPFRQRITPLDREKILFTAISAEIDARKHAGAAGRQKGKQAAGASTPAKGKGKVTTDSQIPATPTPHTLNQGPSHMSSQLGSSSTMSTGDSHAVHAYQTVRHGTPNRFNEYPIYQPRVLLQPQEGSFMPHPSINSPSAPQYHGQHSHFPSNNFYSYPYPQPVTSLSRPPTDVAESSYSSSSSRYHAY